MKFLPFVLKHLLRNWVRSGSTVAAMALSVMVFCTLQSALDRLNHIADTRSPRRLVTRHGVTPLTLLPLSHAEQIRRIPGVRRVAATSMFGGLLPAKKEERADAGGSNDWTTAFQNIAVDAEPYLAMSPELKVDPDQLREFKADLRGCLIGRELARRFGWQLGDHFFLESFASGYRKRGGPFEFVIRGLIDPDPRYPDTETNGMIFHFRYMTEGLGAWVTPQTYTVEIEDPARATEIAAAIDAGFENSSQPTLTETEKEYTAGVVKLVGDLGALVNGIGLAACFTILLVTANTMSMAVRERRTEIAVLKTLGFTSSRVMRLVVGEALLLGALGGALGVCGARGLLWLLDNGTQPAWFGLTGFVLRRQVAGIGLAATLLLGLAAGFAPALSAYRARVTEALRVE